MDSMVTGIINWDFIFCILHRLGLNGFTNPMRDPKTEEFKEHIGQGAKVINSLFQILLNRFTLFRLRWMRVETF